MSKQLLTCEYSSADRNQFEEWVLRFLPDMDENQLELVVKLHYALQQHPSVSFTYQKSDGSIRKATGTNMPTIISQEFNAEPVCPTPLYPRTLSYFDYDRKNWRRFRIERLISLNANVTLQESSSPVLPPKEQVKQDTVKQFSSVNEQVHIFPAVLYGPPEMIFERKPKAESALASLMKTNTHANSPMIQFKDTVAYIENMSITPTFAGSLEGDYLSNSHSLLKRDYCRMTKEDGFLLLDEQGIVGSDVLAQNELMDWQMIMQSYRENGYCEDDNCRLPMLGKWCIV